MMMTLKPKRAIREVMDLRGWTQARLARTLGLSRERVRQLISKEDGPSLEQLIRIAAAMGVTPGVLVDGDGRWRDVG